MNAARWSLLHWVMDLGIITTVLYLAQWAKWALPFGQVPDPGTTFVTPLVLAMFLITWSFFGRVSGLYFPRQPAPLLVELQRVVSSLVLTLIVVASLLLFLKYHHFSRLLLLYFFTVALLFLGAARVMLWETWAFWRSHDRGTRRVLIIGHGECGRRLSKALEENPWNRNQTVGFLAESPSDSGLPILGPLDAVKQIVEKHGVDEVIITEHDRSLVTQVVTALQTVPVRVKVVPDYLELASVTATVTLIGGIPLLELRAPAVDSFDAFLKYTLDLVVSSMTLLALWPLLLVIAVLVKLSSPGPALFCQKRIGENGRVFTMYKFRTMTLDAPSAPPVPDDPDQLGQSNIKTSQNDRHITPLGRFLRRFALDELPQFLNVLKGEMTLVGPRPEVPQVVEMYSSWHLKRLAMKPGLTGPMQVNGGGDLALDDRVKLELVYIQKYSIWEDVKILAKTGLTVVRGTGLH